MTSQLEVLQQRIATLERERDTLTEHGTIYAQALAHLPVAVAFWRLERLDDPTSLRFVHANEAAARDNSLGPQNVGRRMTEIYPEVPEPLLHTYAQAIRSGQRLNLGEVMFEAPTGDKVVFEMQLLPLADNHVAIVHADITDRKRVEEAMRQSIAQEETLRAQNAALAELSTPLIPITDEVMVMPLIGAVDSRRAQQVLDSLLTGVEQSRARVAILDITGVPVVDTQVANALIRAAQAVKLLGAQVILTGIRPEVAQTLVGLGADLSAITTSGSLQSGIASALGQL
jgi:rsbT co-antagonist protein RsbR